MISDALFSDTLFMVCKKYIDLSEEHKSISTHEFYEESQAQGRNSKAATSSSRSKNDIEKLVMNSLH